MNLLDGRRGLYAALLLGLAVRLALFAAAAHDPARFLMPDSGGYLGLARQAERVYALPPDMGADIAQSLNRPPFYPLFLRTVGGPSAANLRAMVLAQIGLGVLSVWLVWRLGGLLFGPGPAAGLATLLLALDPASACYANLLLSECLFTFGLLAAAYLLARTLDAPTLGGAAGAGLALGAATLVRPASLYLPAAFAPMLVFGAPGRRFWWRGAAAFLAVFLCLVGGWTWRNKQVCGEAVFTTMESGNLNFRAVWAVADERGVSFEAALAAVEAMRLPRVQGRHLLGLFNGISREASIRLMLDNPKGLAISSLRGLGYYFFGPGRAALAQLLGLERGSAALAASNALGGGFILAVYAAGVCGVVNLVRRKSWRALALLLAVTGYITVISAAPEAYVRLRVPAMPFFCLLAGAGLDAWLRSRRVA